MGDENKKEAKNNKYEEARKIAKNKVAFIRHFITYAFVLIVLAVINNVLTHGRQWWLWVALIWGIFVFINFLKSFIFQGGGLKKLEDDLVRREMKKMGAGKDEK